MSVFSKNRLEAFSDGVLAIIITIMVLELKVPHGSDLAAVLPLIPTFLSYVLSFIYVSIYWNNHHHLIHAAPHTDGAIMWANSHLLFWLSLVPFVTGWMGENHFTPLPVALYGIVLLCSAFAYWILQRVIVRKAGPDSMISKATQKDIKGNISLVFYIAGIGFAFVNQWMSGIFYVIVAFLWLIPDRRLSK